MVEGPKCPDLPVLSLSQVCGKIRETAAHGLEHCVKRPIISPLVAVVMIEAA